MAGIKIYIKKSSYEAPEGENVNFNFDSYSPPTGNDVDFIF